jgi:tetratricopeptide (TPR) repeat protein
VKTVVDRSHGGKRIIFIGLDGADWRMLDRLMADGSMPRLRELVDQGERRVLLTQHPPLSPLVWTSMMTGVSPLEHRILDFTRFNPVTREQEPITSDERAVPAIWNMALAGGKKTGVFGLWATYPPEAGVVISDRDLPRDYVAATERLRTAAHKWIEDNEPDLAIVYFQGTDEIGHLTSGDIAKARAYFMHVDTILGEFRDLAKRLDAQLIVASDHGFDWGGKHAESSTATATAAKWHRNEGIWLAWPSEKHSGDEAHVDQVCATLLETLGLPKGEKLAAAIGGASGEAVDYRRYYKRVAPNSAGAGNNEAIARLKSLGYIGGDEPARASAGNTSTRTAASFNNEGLILRAENRVTDAEAAFRSALVLAPGYASPRQNLDDLLAARGVERLRAHDCKGALVDFRGVSKESALLWTSIAAAEGCIGDNRAAEEALRRSLALDPNQPQLRSMLAQKSR